MTPDVELIQREGEKLVFMSIAGLALAAVIGGAWWFTSQATFLSSAPSWKRKERWNTSAESPVFLFENSRLTQANASALRLLGKSKTKDISWPDVRTVLAEIVPQIPVSLKALEDGSRVYPEQSEPLAHHLSVEHQSPFTRVELQMGEGLSPQTPGLECMEAPFPIWAQDKEGNILWNNRSFNRTGLNLQLGKSKEIASLKSRGRFSVPSRTGKGKRHFRLLKKTLGTSVIHYAHSAEDTVAAEESRQDVVQTLGKTFAQLSTGLVVFDTDGNLVLFNPAVIDLFGFSAGFLSARPSLESFFDHMRDNRMIPEPKNYTEWRENITERIANGTEARFRENWQLPNGATIRASGLPNPDGGVGFLFEDISSQVSTTRRFRDELALSHALLDSLDEAIAAVDSVGRVVFANKGFQAHWKIDPESSFADFTVTELVNALQRDIAPDYIMEISSFLSQPGLSTPSSLPCLNFEEGNEILHMSRARGQIAVLRHALPRQAREKSSSILAD